jgi:circadian clock protein KaiC
MSSIGVNLEPHVKKGTLRVHASRPTLHGLEMHLVKVHKMVSEFNPSAVVVDPISNFIDNSTAIEAQAMLLRLVDFLKAKQITAVFTHLTSGSAAIEATDIGLSSLIDTWLLLRDIEVGTARSKGLYVLKSRGMPHSHDIREFVVTPKGIELKQVNGKAGKGNRKK